PCREMRLSLACTAMASKKKTVKTTKIRGKKTAAGPYELGLDKVAANYQPLTPLSFLERAAQVFPNRIAIIHGKQRIRYADFYARSRRLASALSKKGIKKGDTVAVMLSNT